MLQVIPSHERSVASLRRAWSANAPVTVPLAVYGVSRLALLLATEIAAAASRSRAPLTSFALVWDGRHYVDVATSGYPEELNRVGDRVGTSLHAFFPGYPAVVRAAEEVLPIGVVGTAILLSTVFGAVAAVLLWRLADRLAGPDVATGAVLLLCFFPGSFVLGWAFSEGLMLCLVLGAALLLLDGRMWPAGALTALATATRPNAVALVLAFAWLGLAAARRREWSQAWRHVAAGALGAGGFVGFHVYLWLRTDEPMAWFRVQREGFGEGVRPARRTLEVIFDEWVPDIRTAAALFTTLLVILALALLVLTLTSKALPGWMKVYAAVILLMAVTSNTGPGSPRLQLVAFPVFVAVAARLRGEWRSLWLAGSSMFLLVLVVAYANPTTGPFHMWAP